MSVLDPIRANPLAARMIPNVDPDFARQMELKPEHKSLGLLTADNDHATYVAIDEATKMADVEVIYARSFYAGARHASGPLSGEIIAMLAGPNPAEVRAGLDAAIQHLKNEALWYSADESGSLAFFPHLVSRTGTYLAGVAGIPVGDPLAYLVAPPLEATLGIDAALKAAAVRVVTWFRPPTETNYSGALLTGDQPACRAATFAFREMVLEVAREPVSY
jgi:ethanolamine utilization protein EutL